MITISGFTVRAGKDVKGKEREGAHPLFKSLLQLVHSHTKVEIDLQGTILHKDIPAAPFM